MASGDRLWWNCGMAEINPSHPNTDDILDPLVREASERISWAWGRYDVGMEEMALRSQSWRNPFSKAPRARRGF